MKNNFLIFLLFYFILFVNSFAEEFRFETSEIKILENGNFINAKNGKAISYDNDIEIQASNFEYRNDLNFLKAFDGTALIKKDNIRIKFEKIEIDQKNLVIKSGNNTEVFDIGKELMLKTNSIVYDRKNKILLSEKSSFLTDKFKNMMDMENFNYDMNSNILKAKDVVFKDKENNILNVKVAFINTKTNKLYGKNIELNLNNKSFNEDNDPRLKGLSLRSDEDFTKVTKGVFTTCKERDKCPPWQLSAKEISHDKKKKIINYKNALLKIYDVPFFYFPKFYHPDPTVKRKSGFLIPGVTVSGNAGAFVSLPYFQVVSDNKDFTFTPRLYSADKLLLQTEFRQVNKNSKSIYDFSFLKEKNKNTKSHFFYDLNKNFDFDYFEDSNLKLSIEQTSNDTYLKANRIVSENFKTYDNLENSLTLDLFSEDFSINANVTAYEDLNKSGGDRYEYILPQVTLNKDIENKTNLNGDFSFTSNNLIKNYDTNIYEKININNLVFKSDEKVSNKGLINKYSFILKNANTSAQNSEKIKNEDNIYFSSLFKFDSSLPLIKENENFQNILTPKISFRVSPEHQKDERDDFERRIDVNNIYSLSRLESLEGDSLEGGASIVLGSEFTKVNKTTSEENLTIKLANNIRLNENKDLPTNNQMGLKTSNVFGEILYNPNQFLTTKYNFSLKNNLKNFSYENLTADLNLNKFTTSFEYINENDIKDKNSYFLGKFKYNFDKFNNINFSRRKNIEKDLTEYYKLIYEYKNDCLAASIEYNKNYYEDRDIRPEENIFLKLTIMPFGEIAGSSKINN